MEDPINVNVKAPAPPELANQGDYVIVFKNGATVALQNVSLSAIFMNSATGKQSEWTFTNKNREIVNLTKITPQIIPRYPADPAQGPPPDIQSAIEGFTDLIEAIIKTK